MTQIQKVILYQKTSFKVSLENFWYTKIYMRQKYLFDIKFGAVLKRNKLLKVTKSFVFEVKLE